MLVCSSPYFEAWDADTASMPSPHRFTKAKCGDIELCNAIGDVDWQRNPVSVTVCEHCFAPDCGGGEHVHISSLRGFVIWSHPSNESTGYDAISTAPARLLNRFGAVGFPSEAWEAFREKDLRVPDSLAFPATRGCSLLEAWLPTWAQEEQRGAAAMDTTPFITELSQILVGTDTLSPQSSLHWVLRWIDWLQERGQLPIEGAIADAMACGAQVETLWTSGSSERDWIGLARWRDTVIPAIGDHHVFLPDSVPPDKPPA